MNETPTILDQSAENERLKRQTRHLIALLRQEHELSVEEMCGWAEHNAHLCETCRTLAGAVV